MFSLTGKSVTETTKALPENGSTDPEAPKARPASSCTEILLMSNRQEASEQFAKAAKAEKAYRTKKKATLARANYNETKTHFKEAFSHFKMAFKGLFSVFKSMPYLISEKRELRRQAKEKKKREKNLQRKQKLEEKLAKEEAATREETETNEDDKDEKEKTVD
jgi:hypothetical protein